MNIFKKSLRAKFTLILFLCGALPLAAASVFFYYTAKDALFENVFRELKWNADGIASVLESHFIETSRNLVIASKNTAFAMYFTDPGNREYWRNEQKKTLKYLRSIYPDMLDEACFIESTGQEISRIIYDKVADDAELSSDEHRRTFFKNSFDMGDAEVYQGRPEVSEDSGRWVIPNATPIFVNGRKAAILHFEITMTYFQRLLKRAINPDRGYGFILNSEGEFMANTLMDLGENSPFPRAVTNETTPSLSRVYKKMIDGENGIEQFSNGGKEFYVIFRPISTSFIKGRNDNRWSTAYAIPADRVYLELNIIRYNIIALCVIFIAVVLAAYAVGNHITKPIRTLAGATNRLAAGETPEIDIKRDDEIGQLSASFKTMVGAVKKRDAALEALATKDGLTGLYNYRHFMETLDKEVKKSARFGRPLSLLIIDIDHFKDYNDTNGHIQGNAALKKMAEVFAGSIREVDITARYGGEEFAVILPETSLDGAVQAAERIREKVERESFPGEESQPNGSLTVSIGAASFPEAATDAANLIEAADMALYKAKSLGRNRVCSVYGGKC
ncbi:MAG: diguanylate cyclase [Deltaproteobacteria bacterium]|nr:diguanylate cyclase [Deltaproteobacteria bacterium]